MQIDNIFPLKRAFQDPRPDYIHVLPGGGKLNCGLVYIGLAKALCS